MEAELPFLATLDATHIRTYHNDVRAAVWNVLGTKTLLDEETRTTIRHTAEAAWVKAYNDDPLSHIHSIAQEEGRRVYATKRRQQLERLSETELHDLCVSHFGTAPDTAGSAQLITLILQHERRHPEAQAQVLPDVETGDTREVLNAYFADLLKTENPTPEDHARARKLLPIMEWHLWQLFDAGERQVYEELRGQLNGLLLKYDIIFREQEGAYAMYLALAMKDQSFTRNKLAAML